MSPGAGLLHRLSRARILAVVRGRDPEACLRSVLTLAAAGVRVVEVSLTSADALEVVRRARAELGPAADLGAGTVRTADQVPAAMAAGASFVVTPGGGPGAAEAHRLGVPAVLGALTPTEVASAHAGGATAVKLFPASLGGPAYLRALRDPFPDVPLLPVGGVALDLVPDYLRAGAVAVGIGSPLLGDAPDGGDLEALRDRAATLLDAVEPADR